MCCGAGRWSSTVEIQTWKALKFSEIQPLPWRPASDRVPKKAAAASGLMRSSARRLPADRYRPIATLASPEIEAQW